MCENLESDACNGCAYMNIREVREKCKKSNPSIPENCPG